MPARPARPDPLEAGRRVAGLVVLCLALAVPVGACATSGGSGGEDSGARGGPDHIPREELQERLTPSTSLYQAVQRLRPRWLRAQRGVSGSGQRFQPVLYVDDTRYGPVTELRRLRVSDAEELRFISATDATTRYGTGVAGGVISVRTRNNPGD